MASGIRALQAKRTGSIPVLSQQPEHSVAGGMVSKGEAGPFNFILREMRDHYKGWMVSYNVHFRESTLATMLRKRRINGESRENDETIEIKQVKDKGA